jgi:hypothetical protein
MTDSPLEEGQSEMEKNQALLDEAKNIREEGEVRWISVELVAERLGVQRPSVYYYMKRLKIPKKRFDLDRKTYIPISQYERIVAAKKAAATGLR